MRSRLPLLLLLLAVASSARAAEPSPNPTAHTRREVEGWPVQVDHRLLNGADAALGELALKLLANRLYEIKLVVPADKVKRLQQVTIYLDRDHGKLTAMQYHPSKGWLKSNGYAEQLAKCVHIPEAARFASPRHHHQQPWAVLHELAHAYHDQVLDFNNDRIKAAWARFKDSGKYEKVAHIDGKPRKHYALTNPMEFFAEMSEAYFGLNDFYPYHRAELKQAEPELFDLLKDIWGPTP